MKVQRQEKNDKEKKADTGKEMSQMEIFLRDDENQRKNDNNKYLINGGDKYLTEASEERKEEEILQTNSDIYELLKFQNAQLRMQNRELKSEIEEQAKEKRRFEILIEQRFHQLEQKLKNNEENGPFTNEYSNSDSTVSIQGNKKNWFRATMKSILQVEQFPPLSEIKLETVSMYAVSVVVDCNQSIIKKSAVSLGSLMFACVQIVFLLMILVESSYPKCSSMVECPSGTYCGFSNLPVPVCVDCVLIEDLDHDFSQSTCPSYFTPLEWENKDLIDLDHTMLRVTTTTEADLLKCFATLHCNNTDLDLDTNFQGTCDYISLNKSKFDVGTWALIVFLALIWAFPVCEDLEETIVEERVLDHHIASSMNIPAEITRFSLRLRRCVMPAIATTATIVLILTDEVSTKNIILNFLTLTFILEADNVVALFFLTVREKKVMEKTVKNLEIQSLRNMQNVFFWVRMYGLFCVLLMIFGLIFVDQFVQDCGQLGTYLWTMVILSFLVTAVGQGIAKVLTHTEFQGLNQRVLVGLHEVSRNFIAAIISALVSSTLLYVLNGSAWAFKTFMSTFRYVFIGAPLLFAGLEVTSRRIKDGQKRKIPQEVLCV